MKQTYYFRKTTLAAAISAVLTSVAAPALSQEAAPPPPAESSYAIQEVVVTATRTKSKVQSVPLAVSVVTGEGITNANIKSVTALVQLDPSIQYDPSNDGGFQIRGIGTLAFDSAAEKAVGMVVDDVVMSLAGGGAGANGLTDVDRVEILRGPQGTLFGKNTTAGVMHIITKLPKLGVSEGNYAVQAGEHRDYNAYVNLNVPLTDKSAARLSVFTDGLDYAGRYTALGNKAMRNRDVGMRGRVLFKPSDDFDLLLAADYARANTNQGLNSLYATTSPAILNASLSNGTVPGPENTDWAGQEHTERRELWGSSATANWRIGNHTLTSVSAYRHSIKEDDSPSDPTPIDNLPINRGGHTANQLTQELRLSNNDDGMFKYVLGALYYHFDDQSWREQAGTLGAVANPQILTLTRGVSQYQTKITSKALFGNLTTKLSDQFNLLTGLRYTSDNSYASSASTPKTYPGRTSILLFPDRGFQETNLDSTNLSYKIGLQYQAAKNVMFYLTNSTGYKGPGTAYYFGNQGSFNAEHVKSWEAGMKSDLLNRRVRLNVSVFDNTYSDFQAQEFLTVPVFFLHIFNAGTLSSKGVEVETVWKASHDMQLKFSTTYADSVYAHYPKNDGKGNITILSNVPLTSAPKLSAILGADYTHELESGGNLDANLNYAWRSKVYSTVNDPASIMGAYGLLNGRLAFTPNGAHYTFGLYGRNLTNQFYRGFLQPGSPNTVQFVPSDARRTVGVFLEGKF